MSGRPRVYLAIGIFYEPERLRAAASALLGWGFSPQTLWQLVKRDGEAAPGPDGRFQLKTLPGEMLDAGEREGADEGSDLSGLCLDALMAGNVGVEVCRHVEHGATVLVAGTEGSDLHDQCVKVLLRNSRHTVHSQEVSLPG